MPNPFDLQDQYPVYHNPFTLPDMNTGGQGVTTQPIQNSGSEYPVYKPPAPLPPVEPSWGDWLMSMGIRTVPAVVGGMVAGPFGAVLGGALGEAGGEAYEGKPFNPAMIGLEGGLNAVPFANLAKYIPFGGPVVKGAVSAGLQGAGLGLTSSVPRHMIESGRFELPSAGEAVGGAVGGGLFGGVLGAGHGLLGGGAHEVPLPETDPTATTNPFKEQQTSPITTENFNPLGLPTATATVGGDLAPTGPNVRTDAYNAYVDKSRAASQEPLSYADWRLHQVSGIPLPTTAAEVPDIVTSAMRQRLLQLGFRKDVIDRMDAQAATNLISMAPPSSGEPPQTKASVAETIASKMESPARMGAMQGNEVAAGDEIRVPKIFANRQYITNMEKAGYELSKMDGDTAVFVKVDSQPQVPAAKLPRELSGAKPRYKDYELEFNNDLDKSLYIIAQEKPSKRDADYLSFVMDRLGVEEAEARSLGKTVRKGVAEQVKNQPSGKVQLRQIHNEGDTEARIPSGGEMSSEMSQILRRIFKPNQPLKTGSMSEFEFRSAVGQIINETDRAEAYKTTLDWHENVMHRHAAGDAEGANIASNIADLADQKYHELSNPRNGGRDIEARIPWDEEPKPLDDKQKGKIVIRFNKGLPDAESYAQTRFLLPDGTMKSHNHGTHYDAARSVDVDLVDALQSGIVRVHRWGGAEIHSPITSAQAEVLADLPLFAQHSGMDIEVNASGSRSRALDLVSKHFDKDTKASTIREWVNNQFKRATDIEARIPFSDRLPRQPLQGGEEIPGLAFQPDEGVVSNRESAERFSFRRGEINETTEIAPDERMDEIASRYPDILEEAKNIYYEKDPLKIVENLRSYSAMEREVQTKWTKAAGDQSRHGIPIPDELRAAHGRITSLFDLAQAKYERASTRQLEGKDIGAKVPREGSLDDAFREAFPEVSDIKNAHFIMPDGTLLRHDQGSHYAAMRMIGETPEDALNAGIIRFNARGGAEVGAPITSKQAQILADAAHFMPDKIIVVETSASETMRGGYKTFPAGTKADTIRAWIQNKHIGDIESEAHIPGTRRTINSVEDLWQTKTQIAEKGQEGYIRDSYVRDRENKMSAEDLEKFKNHPIVRQLSQVIDQMINHILPPELQGKVTSTGILLDTNAYGMLSQPSDLSMPGAIHINFPEMVRRFWKDPIQTARRFVSVVYHEAAHVGSDKPSRPFDIDAAKGDPYIGRFVRDYLNAQAGDQVLDHSADWAGRMIDLYERTGPKFAAQYEDGIRRILEGSAERTGKYSKQVQEAVLLYSRSRRARSGEAGTFARAGDESGYRAEATGDVSGDTETDGIGVRALRRLRGTTGWGQGSTKGVKLDPNEPNIVKEIINLPTNMTTTGDLSAPGRQGLAMIFTPEFWKAMIPSLSAVSKERSNVIDAAIKRLPTFQEKVDVLTGKPIPSIAKEAGLDLMSLGHKLGPREEFSASKWIENGAFLGPEKIGGVPNPIRFLYKYTVGATAAASNRIFTTFLNHLRANRFERLMNLSRNMATRGDETGRAPMEGVLGGIQFQSGKNIGFTKAVTPEQAGEMNPFFNKLRAKEIADFVNTATGRGPLRTHLLPFKQTELNFEKAAGVLGYALFAPKNTFSRIRMLNPSTYIMASPFVRKQYLKAALSTAAAWWTFTELAKNADPRAEVNHDLTSADFGKVRIGDFRLDPAGGFQQFLVAYARLYQGGASSSATGEFHKFGEGYQAQTAFDMGERLFANKLNPVAKFAWDLANASQYNPFHVKDRTAQMFVPLVVQDFIEIQKEDPNLLMPWMVPILFGTGSQIYSKGESVSKFVSPENDWNVTGGGFKDIMPWNLGGGQ